VILKFLLGDGICRSIVSFQLVTYVRDNNPCVVWKQSINSLNLVCLLVCLCSWSGQTAQAVFMNSALSATLELFHQLVHLPLHDTVFSLSCKHSSVNLRGFYSLWPQKSNDSKLLTSDAIWKPSWHVHYNYTSSTEHNSYPTIWVDLAQYVGCVMSTRAHSDKLPGFYSQIALTFWSLFIYQLYTVLWKF
jgi:hypothetical protein